VKTQPHNVTTQELKQSLARARERALQDMHVLEEELRVAVRFETWVQRAPWFWIAGALGAGFLLGVLSGRGN